MLKKLQKEFRKKANLKKAKLLSGFFKTGKGEYGEGDLFLGIMVPQSRLFAKKFSSLSFQEIAQLLKSRFHEERLVAVLILVHNFEIGENDKKEKIFDFYLKNTRFINNWDLVDLSAHKIVGAYLFNKQKTILYKLAHSKNLWERRIAVVSTFYFIKNGMFKDSLSIAKILLHDEYDLIHKAVGWMLREIGKKSLQAEERFLKKHYRTMPRTMLRYAIERFSKSKRTYYLS